ncbi:MAG: tRNA epoxyqueuosine(34) reductase QueG [SAR202 cluster bacterium]|nr:tRNA epoxyqueuosine(34) reductase QueG [SAR202 cluster bacterium]
MIVGWPQWVNIASVIIDMFGCNNQNSTLSFGAPKSIESKIKRCARDLGFDVVGITSADRFERDELAADSRVRDGLMDGLPWYTEERVLRMNRPRELLEGARSVISMAVSYSGDESPAPSSALTGHIARYARGDDYHAVIKKRLRAFVEQLPDVVGGPVRTRVFVDDGPMNDRAAAERSGVGWFGKSTNILTPSHGSWVFLCQVITDIELDPDQPLKKTCGACDLCMVECPTDAIVAPYVVDNRKCISYLTIELRGPIPRDLRPSIGTWVFGCDVCQDVCPVNLKTLPGSQPEFAWRSGFAAPELVPLLELDDEAFSEKFRKSPIKRAKRVGLQRNVCVVLGNIGDQAAVPALTTALANGEPLVRQHAAWALGHIGGEKAFRVLRNAMGMELDSGVISEIKQALAEDGGGP